MLRTAIGSVFLFACVCLTNFGLAQLPAELRARPHEDGNAVRVVNAQSSAQPSATNTTSRGLRQPLVKWLAVAVAVVCLVIIVVGVRRATLGSRSASEKS